MLIIALAAAALAQNPDQLRISTADLDRHADQAAEMSRRVDVAVAAHCAAYGELLAPTHANDPAFCRRGLRRQVVAQLPQEMRMDVWRAGYRAQVADAGETGRGRP